MALILALVASLAVLAAPSAAITDVNILNFALNLECLEAEFYSYAAFGKGLNATLLGGGPGATGGEKAQLSYSVQQYATEIAQDEINHVAFLRSALGAAAIPCPQIDIGAAFSAVINAALGTKATSYKFSPYDNDLDFLLGAFLFEDVGVTAYSGAAPFISDKTTVLAAAAGILSVEAYHAGIIRTLLFQDGAYPVKPYKIQTVDFVQALSNLRAAVGGGKDKGITDPPANGSLYIPYLTSKYSSNLVPTNDDSLAFARTIPEVLAIVYGGSASTPGAFFPQGINPGA
nr:putative extracellular protein CSOL_059a [Pseudococcomyxa simplex]